jgi:hypothetical protein
VEAPNPEAPQAVASNPSVAELLLLGGDVLPLGRYFSKWPNIPASGSVGAEEEMLSPSKKVAGLELLSEPTF